VVGCERSPVRPPSRFPRASGHRCATVYILYVQDHRCCGLPTLAKPCSLQRARPGAEGPRGKILRHRRVPKIRNSGNVDCQSTVLLILSHLWKMAPGTAPRAQTRTDEGAPKQQMQRRRDHDHDKGGEGGGERGATEAATAEAAGGAERWHGCSRLGSKRTITNGPPRGPRSRGRGLQGRRGARRTRRAGKARAEAGAVCQRIAMNSARANAHGSLASPRGLGRAQAPRCTLCQTSWSRNALYVRNRSLAQSGERREELMDPGSMRFAPPREQGRPEGSGRAHASLGFVARHRWRLQRGRGVDVDDLSIALVVHGRNSLHGLGTVATDVAAGALRPHQI